MSLGVGAMNIETGLGRYAAGERDFILTPRLWKPDSAKKGIVWCHTAGESAADAMSYGGNGENGLVSKLCELLQRPIGVFDLGVIGAAAPNDGKATWGNSVAQARINSGLAFLASTTGCSSTVCVVGGASMGGLNSINYAIANPAKVSAIFGVIPVCNLTNWYVSNRGGGSNQAYIAGAWGITYPAALPANADPMLNLASIMGKPYRNYTASDDAFALASEAQALADALGGQHLDLGALGHTEAAIASVPASDLAGFLAPYV